MKHLFLKKHLHERENHQESSGEATLRQTATFYSEVTGLVEEGRADIVYLEYSEAFTTVSHKILIKKLMKYGLDKQPVMWREKG